MRLYFFILLSLFTSANSYAQIAPRTSELNVSINRYRWEISGYSPAILIGNWADEYDAILNKTTGSGTAGYAVGGGQAMPSTYLQIFHNITGGVHTYNYYNENLSAGQFVSIEAKDDVTIEGSTVNAEFYNHANLPHSALHFEKTQFGGYLGSYKIKEGIWTGGEGAEGAYNGATFKKFSRLDIEGSSFIGANSSGSNGGNGLYSTDVLSSVTISNRADDVNQAYIGGNGGSMVNDFAQGDTKSIAGGIGAALLDGAGDVKVTGGKYYGGGSAEGTVRSYTVDDGYNYYNNHIRAEGGTALFLMDSPNFYLDTPIEMIGGDAGDIEIIGPTNTAYAYGGYGLYAGAISTITDITGGTYRGGNGGISYITSGSTIVDVTSGLDFYSNSSGTNYAYGGHGIYLYNAGNATISGDVDTKGGRAGLASVSGSKSMAYATGGAGLRAEASTSLTINNGNFVGSKGGHAGVSNDDLSNSATANGGSGVVVVNTPLLIHGGTYSGAKAGTATGPIAQAVDGRGVWAEDSDVTIDNSSTDTIINDGIYFETTLGTHNLNLNAGTLNGDIMLSGAGTSALSINNAADFYGSLYQEDGIANVTVSSSDTLQKFSDIFINSVMNLNGSGLGANFISAESATFNLNTSTAALNINGTGLQLAQNAKIIAKQQTVTIDGDLILDTGASISLEFGYNGTSQTSGLIALGGQLTATNIDSQISLSGISHTTTGSVEIVTSGTVDFGANSVDDVFSVNLGWLNQIDNYETSGGVTVNYGYNSLTNNRYLSDVDASSLILFDNMILDTNNISYFVGLNSISAKEGASSIRFIASQKEDMAESAFQLQNMVTKQFANRGSDFRTMNGFASSKSVFSPTGVAGPKNNKGLEGWIKAYGSYSSRDEESNFTDYEATTLGTVIGIDKSFNHLLVGIAGGYGRSDIDAGEVYNTKVDTYHGSIYSTLGNESLFVDAAATYAANDAETIALLSPSASTIDSYSASGYIGVGMTYDIKKSISITPETSMLATYYSQEGYNRQIMNSVDPMTLEAYEEWSYLGSLGLNIALQKQIDWNNTGLAVIPEVRAHWLHEFNPDMEDINFTSGGSSGVLGVRPRDEDMLRIGLGFDIWSWKSQNTTFELDYDGLIGQTFMSHTVSGKISYKF